MLDISRSAEAKQISKMSALWSSNYIALRDYVLRRHRAEYLATVRERMERPTESRRETTSP